MARVQIMETKCRRCNKTICITSRSFYGLDALKAKYGSICHDCMTDDERNEMLMAMGEGIVRRTQ